MAVTATQYYVLNDIGLYRKMVKMVNVVIYFTTVKGGIGKRLTDVHVAVVLHLSPL